MRTKLLDRANLPPIPLKPAGRVYSAPGGSRAGVGAVLSQTATVLNLAYWCFLLAYWCFFLGCLGWLGVSLHKTSKSLESLASDSSKVQALLAEIRDKLGK
jgi:hypothetical protein